MQEVRTVKLLDAVTATANGVPFAFPPGKKQFQIVHASTPTLTVKIQGSNDGSTWDDLYTSASSGSAAQETIESDDLYAKHRAIVSAYTGGNGSVTASFAADK